MFSKNKSHTAVGEQPLVRYNRTPSSCAIFALREESAPRTMRKILISLAVAFLVVVLILAIALRLLQPKVSQMASDRVQDYLQHRFKSDVRFSSFRVSLFPHVSGSMNGLELRHNGRTDVPPLIQVGAVHFEASYLGLLRPRPVIDRVRLDGLQIHIPPRQPGGEPLISGSDEDLAKKYPVLVRETIADEAMLVILRASAKPPQPY